MPKVPLINLSQEEINKIQRQRERDKQLITWTYGQALKGVSFSDIWKVYCKEVMKVQN